MVKWYYQLNKNNNSLLSKEHISKDMLPICNESSGYKQFAAFRYGQLYNYSISLNDNERCLYEIILGNRRQKPYFDIDMDLIDKEIGHSREQKLNISLTICISVKNSILKEFKQISDDQIIIMKSPDINKRSFHIIVKGHCVINSDANRKFYNIIKENIPEPWRIYMDDSMYKSIQQFRLFMSTKLDKSRIKQFDYEQSNWKAEALSENPLRDLFYDSLISYTDDCLLLPIELNEEETICYDKIEINNEDINKLKLIIKNMPFSNCFDINEIKETMVIMRRLMPSYCECCKTVHDNENPFIYITLYGNVKFHCRRGKDKLLIGSLNNDFNNNNKMININKQQNKATNKKSRIILESPIESICQIIPKETSENKKSKKTSILNVDCFNNSNLKDKSKNIIKNRTKKQDLTIVERLSLI